MRQLPRMHSNHLNVGTQKDNLLIPYFLTKSKHLKWAVLSHFHPENTKIDSYIYISI